jgi:hypothetical protein
LEGVGGAVGLQFLQDWLLAQFATEQQAVTVEECLWRLQTIKDQGFWGYLQDGAITVVDTCIKVCSMIKRRAHYADITPLLGTPFMTKVKVQTAYFLRRSLALCSSGPCSVVGLALYMQIRLTVDRQTAEKSAELSINDVDDLACFAFLLVPTARPSIDSLILAAKQVLVDNGETLEDIADAGGDGDDVVIPFFDVDKEELKHPAAVDVDKKKRRTTKSAPSSQAAKVDDLAWLYS